MRKLFLVTALCVAAAAFAQKGRTLEGTYVLVKGKSAGDFSCTYIRGAMVIEKMSPDSYAYYGALTPKGYTTVGRTGVYHFTDGKYISEMPAGVPLDPGIDLHLQGDTLFVADFADNAVDSLVWKQVDKTYPFNKWLQKGIADSRESFRLQKNVK
ncbi:hypothetical protein ACTHGU_02600 [Chitinophagaceae bacterium MMS25-I14]